jgi:hypothetical protein
MMRSDEEGTLEEATVPEYGISAGQLMRLLEIGNTTTLSKLGDIPLDTNALIQAVLRETYMETVKELQDYADKVKFYNESKKAVRTHLTSLRRMHTTLLRDAVDARIAPVPLKRFTVTGANDGVSWEVESTEEGVAETEGELTAYVESLEQTLSTLREEETLATTDLQKTLQNQQQTLGMISTISNVSQDTAMLVIRNIN